MMDSKKSKFSKILTINSKTVHSFLIDQKRRNQLPHMVGLEIQVVNPSRLRLSYLSGGVDLVTTIDSHCVEIFTKLSEMDSFSSRLTSVVNFLLDELDNFVLREVVLKSESITLESNNSQS
jgi:hypothetical protein